MPVGGPPGAQAQNETPIGYWSCKRLISSSVHHCLAKLTKASHACCQFRACWAYAVQFSHPMTRAKASSCAPSVWWSAHTSASWKPFRSTPDPGFGWQTCNLRSEFPILTKTCHRPTLQVKSFTEIKDASVPAVQNLMPRHVPVQSRRGTQQSTQQSSPFHMEFVKLLLVIRCPAPKQATGTFSILGII